MARKVILSSGNYSTDDAAKSFFTNSENIAGDALFSFDSTNEALYGNKGDGEVIKISSDKMNENKFATKTYVDEKITVTGVKDGEKVISLDGKELSSTLSLQYDEDNKKIRLIGIDNVTVGDEIDASNFLKGGMIKSANLVEIKKDEDGTYYYEESDGTKVIASGVSEEGTYIKFVFDTTDTDNTLFINVSSLIDTYKAGEGIKISDYEISADTDVLAKKTDIPSVGDAKVIVKQNGTEKGTFTLNQSGEDITIELTDNDTQVTVDEQLDKESTNPVQNKVIYESLDKKVSSVSGEGCVAVTTDTADTTALTVSLNYDSESGDSGDVKFAVDTKGNLTGTVEGWDDKANASDIITYKADDKTISATTSEDKKTVTFNAIIDTGITSGSTNSVTSKAIYDELTEKAEKTHTHNASEIDGLAHIADAGYTSTNVKDAILEIEEKVKNAASGNGEINAINKITVNGAEASIENTIAEITIPITKISVNGNEQKIDESTHSVDITVPMNASGVTFDSTKHYKKDDETTSSYTGANVETSITDVEKAITTLEDKVDNLSLGETNVIEHIKVNGGDELTPDSGKTVNIPIDAFGVTFDTTKHYKKEGETTSDYSGTNVQESIVALEEALDGVVSEGGQPNKLEKININNSDIAIGDGKTASVTIKVNDDETLAEVANNVVNLKVDAPKVTFNADSHSSTAYTGTNVETSITDVEKAITTLDEKVANLSLGETNVIEHIKVNGGNELTPDSGKTVNIPIDASGVTFDKNKHVDTGYTGETVETSIVEIEQSILDNEEACAKGINDLDTRLKNLVIPTKLSDLTIDQEVTATVSNTTGIPAVAVNKYGDGTLEFAFSNLKGDSGKDGVGITGVTEPTYDHEQYGSYLPLYFEKTDNTQVELSPGIPLPTIVNGVWWIGDKSTGVQAKGADGTGITVKASSGECTSTGDGYIDADGNLQIFNAATNTFTNAGQIKGPQGDSVQVQWSTDGTNWHNTYVSGDIYLREKVGETGSWTSAIKVVGNNGNDGASIQLQWGVDGTSNWHDTYQAGDKYIRVKMSNETDWSSAIKAVGEDGNNGASVQIEWSTDASDDSWHSAYAEGDKYMHLKMSNETDWSSAIKAVGEDGKNTVGSYTASAPLEIENNTISLNYDTDDNAEGWVEFSLTSANSKQVLSGKVNGWDTKANKSEIKSYSAGNGITLSETGNIFSVNGDTGNTDAGNVAFGFTTGGTLTGSVNGWDALNSAVNNKVSSVSGGRCISVTADTADTTALTVSLKYDSDTGDSGDVKFAVDENNTLTGKVEGWDDLTANIAKKVTSVTGNGCISVTSGNTPKISLKYDSNTGDSGDVKFAVDENNTLTGKVEGWGDKADKSEIKSYSAGNGITLSETGNTFSVNADTGNTDAGNVAFGFTTGGTLTGSVNGWDTKADKSDILPYTAGDDSITIKEEKGDNDTVIGYKVSANVNNPTITFKQGENEYSFSLNQADNTAFTLSEGSKVTVDAGLKSSSDNPVANSAITVALAEKLANFNISPTNETGTNSVTLLGTTQNAGDAFGEAYVTRTAVTMDDSGNLHATGFYETSDENLKDFGDDITVDYDKLKSIPKKYFTWKGKNKLNIGTSAQKVQEVYPELVSSKYETLNVDYAKLSVIALAAIDNLNERLTALETENTSLKETIAKLTSGAE